MENNKIICIFEKGFSKISLPNRYIINVDSCDDGCYITTKNMIDDLNELNKFIDYQIEFFRAGLNAVIKKWINGGFKETPEEINEIIISEYKNKS